MATRGKLSDRSFHTGPYATFFVKALTPYMIDAGSLLDVGCGTGDQIAAIAAYFPRCRYVGIDISDANIAQARTTFPWGNFLHSDFSDDKISARFSVVFSYSVMHVSSIAKAEFIARCAALIEPGGTLVIGTPCRCARNTMIMRARSALSFLPRGLVLALARALARLLYPRVDDGFIDERLAYVLHRHREHLGIPEADAIGREVGLRLIDTTELFTESFFKEKHVLFVFRKT